MVQTDPRVYCGQYGSSRYQCAARSVRRDCGVQQWTVCKIQHHLGLPGPAILKAVSLVSRLLDREALVHAHQYKS